MKARGAHIKPQNRFTEKSKTHEVESDYEFELPNPKTEFISDDSKTILSTNNSPDIPFTFSINPYRGCEHGCIYCYARPTHEYFDLSSGTDFETKIFVKHEAPKLLEDAFSKPNWKPQVIALSGVTDPYQPVERKYKLTRSILETCLNYRNPVGIITKNQLVVRDSDVLLGLTKLNLVHVNMSITTLDAELVRKLEPRTSLPIQRLKAIENLAKQGISVGVMVAPIIPGLNDFEIHQILKSAADAGARFAGTILLRLPYSIKDLFEEWLERNVPLQKEKILHRIRETRDGELNKAEFGERMRGTGNYAEQIMQSFRIGAQRYGFNKEKIPLSTDKFVRPARNGQMSLFG